MVAFMYIFLWSNYYLVGTCIYFVSGLKTTQLVTYQTQLLMLTSQGEAASSQLSPFTPITRHITRRISRHISLLYIFSCKVSHPCP